MPRSHAKPAALPNSVLGLMPTAITTKSASTTEPSLKRKPVTRSSPKISAVLCSIRNFMPRSSKDFCNMRAAGLSSWRSIRMSSKCTTETSMPCFIKPFAASKPSKPPPITTAFWYFCDASSMVSTSLMSRKPMTPCLFAPGIGRINGNEPVAIIKRSYGATVPSAAMTSHFSRSICVTFLPLCSVMPLSAYHASSLRMICSMVFSLANTGESIMRL